MEEDQDQEQEQRESETTSNTTNTTDEAMESPEFRGMYDYLSNLMTSIPQSV